MNDVGCIVAIRPRFLCTMPCCHITDEKDTPERSSCLARPLARLMIKSSYDPIRRPGIAWTSENKFLAKPTTTVITRPRRPILGILDGLGRSTGRGLLSSPVLSLMLGFQYATQPARKGNRGYVGIRF